MGEDWGIPISLGNDALTTDRPGSYAKVKTSVRSC